MGKKSPYLLGCATMMLLMAVAVTVMVTGGESPLMAATNAGDSCETCHSDPDFLVKNKKLYDYYQNWTLSLHKVENVTCVDCHGGNPKVKTKKAAHGGSAMSAARKTSPINYANIPKTCAKCHKKVYQRYQESEHFQHLKSEKQEGQGPNCVTCHGSVNLRVLNVNNVRTTCAKCHNEKTENNPEIPDHAEKVLHDFLSIDRYARYITLRSDARKTREMLERIESSIRTLSEEWHTFNLEEIEEKTQVLLQEVKEKRSQLKKERKSKN